MENTNSVRSRVCPTWKLEEAGISRAPGYSVHFLKICRGVGHRVIASTRTSLTEQFDSGVFDYARVSVQTAATLSTNCRPN